MFRSQFNAHMRRSQLALRERVGDKWSSEFQHPRPVFMGSPRPATCRSLKCNAHFDSHVHQGDPCMICGVASLISALDVCRANERFLGATARDVRQLCEHVVGAFTEWEHLDETARQADGAARTLASDEAREAASRAHSEAMHARRMFTNAADHVQRIAATAVERAQNAADQANARAFLFAIRLPGRTAHLDSLPGARD